MTYALHAEEGESTVAARLTVLRDAVLLSLGKDSSISVILAWSEVSDRYHQFIIRRWCQ